MKSFRIRERSVSLLAILSIVAVIVVNGCKPPVTLPPCTPPPGTGNSTPPPASMVNWWPFDEAAGPTADDVVGNNQNPGTYGPGAASPVPAGGFVANALKFDGVDDFVTILDDIEVDFSTGPFFCSGFTIDAWIKTDQGQGTAVIVDKRETPSAPIGYSVFLYNGRLGLQLADGIPAGSICGNPTAYPCTNYTLPSSKNVADNCWHHIAVTVQVHGSKTACPEEGGLYVDGQVVYTFVPRTHSLSNGNSHGTSIVNTADLYVGKRMPAFGGGGNFKGLIDELEFFHSANEGGLKASGALTAAQIKAIYNAGPAGKIK